MHVIADYCINPAAHQQSGVDCMPAAGVWATVVLIPTSYTQRCVFLTALSPSFLYLSVTPVTLRPPLPLSFKMCLTPSPSALHSPFLLSLSCVVVSFYLYTGLQTFPPMATLAMRAYPWLTGSPHPPLWVPPYLWLRRNLCHFIIRSL